MKKFYMLFLTLSLLVLANSTHGQGTFGEGGLLPFNPSRSVIFGYDIYINNQPDQDQQQATLCSAFNGWLYSTYSYDKNGIAHISIMQSQDDGKTWALFFDGSLGLHNCIFTKIEMIAAGNVEDELKIFLGGIYYDTLSQGGGMFVIRINGITGIKEGTVYDNTSGEIKDIALATDYPHPAYNSNPFSVGFLCSTKHTTDSVVFRSSSNGGVFFDNYRVLAAGQGYFHNVDLSYSYSPTYPNGQYFATWEQKDDHDSEYGHLYASHSSPNFNSPFTVSVCLDCPDPDLSNKCSNPVISCISGNSDNDSLNITEVILFENINSQGNKDITGFYNRKAATGNNFLRMNIAQGTSDQFQPDICYNQFDSAFMATYYDEPDQKLPFIKNNHSLVNPEGWSFASHGYNDNPNLINPDPKVILNYEKQSGAAVWRAERSTGKGAAMYDAEYIYYTGLTENNSTKSPLNLKVFPNPCSSFITIEFELEKNDNTTIILYDLLGQPVRKCCDQNFAPGKHKIKSNISDLPPGTYMVKFTNGKFIISHKINILH